MRSFFSSYYGLAVVETTLPIECWSNFAVTLPRQLITFINITHIIYCWINLQCTSRFGNEHSFSKMAEKNNNVRFNLHPTVAHINLPLNSPSAGTWNISVDTSFLQRVARNLYLFYCFLCDLESKSKEMKSIMRYSNLLLRITIMSARWFCNGHCNFRGKSL